MQVGKAVGMLVGKAAGMQVGKAVGMLVGKAAGMRARAGARPGWASAGWTSTASLPRTAGEMLAGQRAEAAAGT